MRAPKKYSEKDVQYILSCVRKHGVSRGCVIAAEILGRSFIGIINKYYKETNPVYKQNVIMGINKGLQKRLIKISNVIKRDLITEIYSNPVNLQQCFESVAEKTNYSTRTVEQVWYQVLKKETKVFQINENSQWNVKNKPRRR